MPKQQSGTRPSRALPYSLHVSGLEDPSTNTVWLRFKNDGKQAAVFHVYDKLHLGNVPRRRYTRSRRASPTTPSSTYWPTVAATTSGCWARTAITARSSATSARRS
jgi:hypothetical protein